MDEIAYLQVEPTTRCNFRCIFCGGRKTPQQDIDYNLYEQLINQIGHIKHIHIQGEGEPLLYNRFFDMLRLAEKKCDIMSTVINGSLLSEYREDLINSNLDHIGISIESVDPNEFYRIRGGNLPKIIQDISSFITARNERKKEKPTIGFEVVYMKDNIQDLKEIAKLYKELGMNGSINVQPLSSKPYHVKSYDDLLKRQIPDRKDELVVKKQMLRIDKDILEYKKINNKLDIDIDIKLRQSLQQPTECISMHRGLFMNAQGKFSFCCLIKDGDENFLGDMNLNSFEDIMNERKKRLSNYQHTKDVPNECQLCYKTGDIDFGSNIYRY